MLGHSKATQGQPHHESPNQRPLQFVLRPFGLDIFSMRHWDEPRSTPVQLYYAYGLCKSSLVGQYLRPYWHVWLADWL